MGTGKCWCENALVIFAGYSTCRLRIVLSSFIGGNRLHGLHDLEHLDRRSISTQTIYRKRKQFDRSVRKSVIKSVRNRACCVTIHVGGSVIFRNFEIVGAR